MAKERQQWVVRDDDDEDLMQKMFMMKVNHGGSFTPKGRREYILGSNQDVKELLKYVVRNNVIEVYIEHDSTTLDTYYNRPRDGVLTNENIPSSPYDSKGFTRFPLQIPPSSKPLTIGEEIQSKPSEIPWLEREDYGDDIVVVVAKADTKFKSDDNLEHEEEYFEMNDDSDRFVDEKNMTEDVPVDMQPFKNDMEKNDTLVRIMILRELVKDRIRKHSVKSRRKLSITKNDNERVRAICVGIIPTYSSFDPDLDFSQASALKKGIKASGRDILRLEGCFMKGPYPGQILTGVGVDANNGIYLVAYAVVKATDISILEFEPAETKSSGSGENVLGLDKSAQEIGGW
ncbi:hypothetical protein Tco_0027276 [Tanacetum coccineum]